MKKFIVRRPGPSHAKSRRKTSRRKCKRFIITLETGEKIKRGCGQFGLIPNEAGWRCFYCGNFIYEKKLSLESAWFHFKIAREYWRPSIVEGRGYINGIPVAGSPDPLPRRLLGDLVETRPPRWFPYFMLYNEEQFNRYLETYPHGNRIS